MRPFKTVVIGYGFAGRSFHAYLVSLTPGLELHGIASRDPDTRAKIEARGDCRAYGGFEQVLDDPEVDLVVLATPNDLHADYAVRALQAGKHVVTDKPMCLTLDEADRMIAAADESGKVLSVFQNRRWDGDFLTVRELIEDGRLGAVRWIEMAWQNFGPPGRWRGRIESGGGRMWDLGAHLLDQMLLLFPQRVTGVYCRMHHDFPEHDVESDALLVLHFQDGHTGVCDVSSLSAIKKPRFTIRGDRGTFVKYGLDPQEKAMIAGDIDAAVEDPAQFGRLNDGQTEIEIPTLPGRWRSFYENIAEVLAGRAELAVKPEEVRRVIAVFDAAFESARTNSVVAVDVEPVGEEADSD